MPIIEIAVTDSARWFVKGLAVTLALILSKLWLRAILVRSQGVLTFLSVQQRLQRGEVPAQRNHRWCVVSCRRCFITDAYVGL
ncbi:FxsA family protein [Vibrio metschnikovii]